MLLYIYIINYILYNNLIYGTCSDGASNDVISPLMQWQLSTYLTLLILVPGTLRSMLKLVYVPLYAILIGTQFKVPRITINKMQLPYLNLLNFQ